MKIIIHILFFAMFVWSAATLAADKPIIYAKTYEVSSAEEALAMFHQSRVMAQMYFKSDDLKFGEKIENIAKGKYIVTYTWRKR